MLGIAVATSCLLGAFVNSRAWTFRHPAPSPVGDAVLIGRTPTRRDLRRAGGGEEEPYIFHFPDGNASIARLLVSRLVPGVFDGPGICAWRQSL